MNLFELFFKIGVDDQASGAIQKLTNGLGNSLRTAAKIGVTAVSTAMAGITALTKIAVSNYAEYEQLVGGVDTLFKDASQKVQEYAANAYKTAGMSANDYMANATAFSASLISALGDDTEAAAEYANRAMVSMSDNANRMGTSLDSIVQTYQSLARGNFAMLDNLKLGYGGTKAELERLIADAASYIEIQKEMGITVDASSTSFDNIVNAIAVVQGKLGIVGATAQEAGTTIEGSVNSMKSAWQNLLTGLVDGDADLGSLIDNLVSTIIGDGTDSNFGVLGNVIPAVESALGGIAGLIEGAAPKIVEILPGLVTTIVPALISASTQMVNSVITVLPDLLQTIVGAIIQNAPIMVRASIQLVNSLIQGIQNNYSILIRGAIDIVKELGSGILKMLPEIVRLGLDLVTSLAYGLIEAIPELIPATIDVIIELAEMLTSPEMLGNLIDAGIILIISLVGGLIDAIPRLLEAAPRIVENLVIAIVQNVPKLLQAAVRIIGQLFTGIIDNLPKIGESAGKIIGTLINGVKNLVSKIWNIGSDIVNGVWDGINAKLSWFTGKVRGFFSGIVNSVKKTLGIASPSKVFAEIGTFMADGLGVGFESEIDGVKKGINNSMDFGTANMGFATSTYSGSKNGRVGGNYFGDIIINIDGAKYDDEQSLALAVGEAIQNLTDRRLAAYA